LPPGEVDRAEIDKARKRTKARLPSIAMSIEDCGTGPNSQASTWHATGAKGGLSIRPSASRAAA
jgi:hypothetical protein